MGEAGGTAVKSGEAPLKLRVKKKGRGILDTAEVPSSPFRLNQVDARSLCGVEDVFRASPDAEEARRSKKELQSLEALSGLSFEDDSLAEYRAVAGNRRQGGPGVGSSNNVAKGIGKKNERAQANPSREISSFGSGPWGNTVDDSGTTRLFSQPQCRTSPSCPPSPRPYHLPHPRSAISGS